jgi:metal-responsive CopG/Arc/MetJ family transcriptional regulator
VSSISSTNSEPIEQARRTIHLSLYLEEDLYDRLSVVANAINRASRQDIIRSALNKELNQLENRLGAGERIIIRRSAVEFVPAD